MFTQTRALPRVLTFSEAKYYVFSAVFAGLAVFVPWLAHQFHIAGQIYLPMHFFVILAGLLFGWRTGLLVGLISPLMSYSLTQMPVMALLPQVVLELAIYGLAIGILRERTGNVWISLFSAMIFGRVVRILFVMLLAPKMDPIKFIQISWPGIVLQIALIPAAIYLCSKILKNSQKAAGD